MASVPAVSSESSNAVPTAPGRGRFGYLIFAVCATLYLLPFMRIMLSMLDEGILVEGAVRVAHGQLFARDFFEIMGPGTFYWLAAFFKVFGVTFLATRICLFVSSLGTGLLIYFLTRRISQRFRSLPCLLVAGTYFGLVWPAISHHVDSNFFGLLSVACMVLWHDRRNTLLLLAAGALAGITTCILQPKGGLLLIAFLIWLAIERWRNRVSLPSLGLVIASYSSVIGAVVVYFWSKGALSDLAFATVLHNLRFYGPMNVVPYASGIVENYWDHRAIFSPGMYWTVPLAAICFVPFLFSAALPGVSLVLAAVNRRAMLSPILMLYGLCGAALWLSEYHRKDISHLVMGSPLLVILCVHFLAEFRNRAADFALQSLLICATSLSMLNLLLTFYTHPTQTRVGTVAMYRRDPTLTYIDEHVKPGTEIFIYPFLTIDYFLTATEDPTRFSGLTYRYNTPEQYLEAMKVLEERKVPYVVWDTTYFDRVLPKAFPSLPRFPKSDYIMEPYLESHYKVVWENEGVVFMERKAVPQAR
jgi:hypothetical protein